MTAYETRAKAREALTNKWGKSALISLVFILLTALLSIALCFIPIVGPIAIILLELPLAYGFICSFIKLKRGEYFTYTSFFKDAIDNIATSWFIVLRIVLKLLPYILGIIGVFILIFISVLFENGAIISIIGLIAYIALFIALSIKSMLYSLVFYILYDNPTMSALGIVEESESLMMGNRWRFFCLSLSFIGWALLSSITLGIGYFFLIPYMQTAIIEFYEELAKPNNKFNSENDDDYKIFSKNADEDNEENTDDNI